MKTIYIDLDGVLCDFDAKVCEITGQPYQPTAECWQKLQTIPHLFRSLEKTDFADDFMAKVLNLAKVRNYKVEILTASPKPTQELSTAPFDKVWWVRKHYGDITVNVVKSWKYKKEFSNRLTILYDDSPRNVRDFSSGMGIGILINKSIYNGTYPVC